MTKNELVEERRRALNLLDAYEAGTMMSLDGSGAGDFENDHTEAQILVLRERIAELDRRIEGHPDQASE